MKETKGKSWFELRTIEDEASKDIHSAICIKYFTILIGALFAIVLAKPEVVSGTVIGGMVHLGPIVYWYSMVGFFGLMGYEGLVMYARIHKTDVKIPIIFLAMFGLYVSGGFLLFTTIFGRLLGVDK